MSTDVSGRNLLQDKLLKQYELYGQQYIKPKIPDRQNVANPIYTKPIQYFDSPVFNSHLYPNFKPIKPFEPGFMPPNRGSYIDESIQKTMQVVGGKVYTLADAERIMNYQ